MAIDVMKTLIHLVKGLDRLRNHKCKLCRTH